MLGLIGQSNVRPFWLISRQEVVYFHPNGEGGGEGERERARRMEEGAGAEIVYLPPVVPIPMALLKVS
jgi:hypothetical protein